MSHSHTPTVDQWSDGTYQVNCLECSVAAQDYVRCGYVGVQYPMFLHATAPPVPSALVGQTYPAPIIIDDLPGPTPTAAKTYAQRAAPLVPPDREAQIEALAILLHDTARAREAGQVRWEFTFERIRRHFRALATAALTWMEQRNG